LFADIWGHLTAIHDPEPQAGIRRKPALPERHPVDAYLAGKTLEDCMDPECHEAFGISGPPKEAPPPRDRDRNDNRRVPSHDEPPKQKKRNTRASKRRQTKVELQAELVELRAAAQEQSQAQLPASTAPAAVTALQLSGVRTTTQTQFQHWQSNTQYSQELNTQFGSLAPPQAQAQFNPYTHTRGFFPPTTFASAFEPPASAQGQWVDLSRAGPITGVGYSPGPAGMDGFVPSSLPPPVLDARIYPMLASQPLQPVHPSQQVPGQVNRWQCGPPGGWNTGQR